MQIKIKVFFDFIWFCFYDQFNFISFFFFPIGIYYTLTIMGPALGYVIGGQILQIYTDFYAVDPNSWVLNLFIFFNLKIKMIP